MTVKYRLFLVEPKHRYPDLLSNTSSSMWLVTEWQPKVGDSGMWCEVERHHDPEYAYRQLVKYRDKYPAGDYC